MCADLPSGTVTFLFTDVEGSTRLLHALGAEVYAEALAEHRRIVREACSVEGGVEVDTQGDAFFFVFPSAPSALAAASAFTERLASGPIQVRVGLHTGTPLLSGEGYVGSDVHLGARVSATGHGGQVLLSASTASLLASAKSAEGFSLSDLGEHRLKDISEPVSIFQLGDGSFPPLKTISNTNLPRPASSFLGREAELAEVLARIEQGVRLLTLTGPGGTGKTRLALEAAASLVPDYKAGVFWVGLASLRDPTLVTETIAQALGAKDGLASHIQERELLILLDNLEQVIEAAPELAALLEACPNLTLLVTSRELLRVRGEVEYPVPPLASPEAVSLFCDRAQHEPTEEIGELCARLDSLPLALELAAARTRALTPRQILERLAGRLDLLQGGRDADPRQQTLRATIAWSYDLLSPEEQELFARLSVFQGGCTLEAAEEVCDADLDALQSLVEKSLLRFTPSDTGGRYWMLETIREYAGERLEELEEAEELRRRHAGFFAIRAERTLGYVGDGRLEDSAIDEVALDRDNIREALAWCWTSGRDELGIRLGASATRYWRSRGLFRDADAWLEEAGARIVKMNQELQLQALKASALIRAWARADSEAVTRDIEHAMPLAEALDLKADVLWLAGLRAQMKWQRGDLEGAIRLFDRSLAQYRELGDRWGEAMTLSDLGQVHRDAGSFDSAAEILNASVALLRELGERGQLSETLHGLGDLALDRDDLNSAAAYYLDAIRITPDEPRVAGYCLAGLASIIARRGRTREAATLWGAVAVAEDQLGFRMSPPERHRYEKHLDPLSDTTEWTAGRELTLQAAIPYARRYLD